MSKDLAPFLDPRVATYIGEHRDSPDELLSRLIAETQRLGPTAVMQLSPTQGALLGLITKLVGATEAVEVGTFTGYSSICIAQALGPDGHLLCCDVNDEWTSVARRYWGEAGLGDRIELRLAPAVDTLASFPEAPVWDLAFIDADKGNYPAYWDLVVRRLRPGGVVLVDNVLWGGDVADPAVEDPATQQMRSFNDLVVADTRVESIIVPLGDGLTIARSVT